VLASPCARFYLQLIEPEIDTLEADPDETLRRVAFGTPDVRAAVRELTHRGLDFVESAGVHTEDRGALTQAALGGVAFELVHHSPGA
jgi:4-hydroxyphenylpyruvate dioxygenase